MSLWLKKIDLLNKIFPPFTLHIPNIRDVPGVSYLKGIEKYKSRIIPLMSSTDLLLLPQNQLKNAVELLEYFNELFSKNLSESNIFPIEKANKKPLSKAILEDSNILKELKLISRGKIAEFYSSKEIEKIVKKIDKRNFLDLNVARVLNNKFLIREILKKKAFLVPESILLSKKDPELLNKLRLAFKKLRKNGYKEFSITELFSCSGSGIHRFSNFTELENIVSNCLLSENFIIEGWIDNVVCSPSCQIWLDENIDSSEVFSKTEQILSETMSHQGNIKLRSSIYSEKFINTLNKLVITLHALGARGIIGVDFLVTSNIKNNFQQDIYIVEVNGRQTGAVYGGLLANLLLKNLPHKKWLLYNNVPIKSNISLSDYVDHLTYNKAHFSLDYFKGIIVMSNGNFENNKSMVLCIADSRPDLFELLKIASYGQIL